MAGVSLDKQTFLHMAKGLGFDPGDPHLDELYPWVERLFEGLEPLDELDLEGVELEPYFVPEKER
jgi:hypothetical protein